MKKTNIKIIVQSLNDYLGVGFANEIETAIQNIIKNYKNLIDVPTLFSITSSSDGRQTATIVFYTDTEEKAQIEDKSLFDSYHIKSALKYFLSIKASINTPISAYEESLFKEFINFLTDKKD